MIKKKSRNRSPQFTPKKIKEILELRRLGFANSTCARSSGVSPSTLHGWLKKGETDMKKVSDNKGEFRLQDLTQHAKFNIDYKKATYEFIKLHHKNISDQAINQIIKVGNKDVFVKGDWKASKYLLAITDPKYNVSVPGVDDTSNSSENIKALIHAINNPIKKDNKLNELMPHDR
jgi:hypothetical protein